MLPSTGTRGGASRTHCSDGAAHQGARGGGDADKEEHEAEEKGDTLMSVLRSFCARFIFESPLRWGLAGLAIDTRCFLLRGLRMSSLCASTNT